MLGVLHACVVVREDSGIVPHVAVRNLKVGHCYSGCRERTLTDLRRLDEAKRRMTIDGVERRKKKIFPAGWMLMFRLFALLFFLEHFLSFSLGSRECLV